MMPGQSNGKVTNGEDEGIGLRVLGTSIWAKPPHVPGLTSFVTCLLITCNHFFLVLCINSLFPQTLAIDSILSTCNAHFTSKIRLDSQILAYHGLTVLAIAQTSMLSSYTL